MEKQVRTSGLRLIKASALSVAAVVAVSLSGCAALGTAVNHRNLTLQTKMSNTVFLNPVSKSKQTVYVRVGNTSGQTGMNFSSQLKRNLTQHGYRVMSSLSHAHYLLQANVIKAGKTNARNVNSILHGAYGDAIGTGLMGLGIGAVVGDSGDATIAGGLIGSAVGFAADTLIKDEIFGMVTDVQLSVRSKQTLHQTVDATSQQGNSAVTRVTSSGGTHWMRYRTRIVTTADKVNLSFSQAKPKLKLQTAKSIAGLFV
jgi:hypothetical protein